MSGLTNVIVTASSVVLLVAAVSVSTPGNANAQKKAVPTPVIVTNEATESVPVAIQGVPTVDVRNLPAVQVANFPAVQAVEVGNFPAVQNVAGSVEITGVPTVAIQAPTPFHANFTIGLNPGFATIAVPAGKRLVVQSITVTTANTNVRGCGAVSFSDNQVFLYELSLTDKAINTSSWCFGSAAGDALFWSTAPAVNINLPFFNADSAAVLFRVIVSGYLAD